MPKLWRYNLHYFDYLHDFDRSVAAKCRLVSSWIEHNPPGTEDAWEPYPVSLRIVNWVKFFLLTPPDKLGAQQPPRAWLANLSLQAAWLEDNIEYHILANHYLKNGVALFFAGMYFQGHDADRWRNKGLRILREELREQFLEDGGHFERSPMYHSICVMDYLDVLNLISGSRKAMNFGEEDHFRTRITQALDFLKDICLTDGEIPLLNDSAFSIAPSPAHIFAYASEVMGYQRPNLSGELSVTGKPHSGYYVMRKGNDMMIIDCGEVGPSYQPGHAHCDMLSYELAVNGRRVIVDSGVFDYEPSSERAYARSTRAHNTVVVDGEEQSEIWGAFRVARRAKPLRHVFKQQVDGSVLFEGGHDGYARLAGKPIHKRHIFHDGQASWVIKDTLEGTGAHRMDSYVHVHPDFQVVQNGASIQIVGSCETIIATVEALEPNQGRVEQCWYFPEFGLKRENHVIVFSCSGQLPIGLSYRIQKMTNQNQ